MSGKRSSILMSKLAVHWAWIYPAPNFARCWCLCAVATQTPAAAASVKSREQ